jgi:hypothetical protein
MALLVGRAFAVAGHRSYSTTSEEPPLSNFNNYRDNPGHRVRLPMNITRQLKAELWKRFGSTETPAEWDGHVYGGGRLSQRFWEYFKALELLDLDADSVVVDIGGGSNATCMGFFAALLSTSVKKVIVFDPNISQSAIAPKNVEFVRSRASFYELRDFMINRPELTHVASISVFEHIDPKTREGIVRAINEFFHGPCFVSTFEFHAKRKFFDYQLTAKTVSPLFEPLTNYYLDECCASPVWCENAFDKRRLFRLAPRAPIAPTNIPQWYPLAVRFLRREA